MNKTVQEYLDKKKLKVGRKHYQNIHGDMFKLSCHLQNAEVGTITHKILDNFFYSVNPNALSELSGKTKHNIRSTVVDYLRWAKKMGYIDSVPDVPKVTYKLGWRTTISKDQQDAILEEVAAICDDPKVSLCLKFLCTYVNVRPGEMVDILTEDIDLAQKRIRLRGNTTKEGSDKFIYLLDEDVETLESASHHNELFCKPNGKRFGRDYLYRWWKRACRNLDIKVDLYGGTRHSTVIYLRSCGFTPEEIKRASMHSTNKAFERYLQLTPAEVTPIYQATRKP
jgi:integrase